MGGGPARVGGMQIFLQMPEPILEGCWMAGKVQEQSGNLFCKHGLEVLMFFPCTLQPSWRLVGGSWDLGEASKACVD